MSKMVNILGTTQKEQWLTAIRIYDASLRANVEWVLDTVDEFDVGELADAQSERLRAALRVLDNYTEEMKRLIEGVLDD